jgi:OFA family oxalate/formate antiporter-like MFS transporter
MPSQLRASRWAQLLLGLVVMMAVSSPQYVWTLFVKPFQAATGAGLPTVQITFSVLIVVQTLFSPAQGWLVDRFGPKALVVGAALAGIGWILSAHIDNIWMLLLTYGLLCGVGTGIVYVGVIGLMARWFPDRRGFAIGIVAAGYGMGAMLTTFPIASSGAPMTLMAFGVILGSVGVLAALGLREPRAGEAPAPASRRAHGEDVTPAGLGITTATDTPRGLSAAANASRLILAFFPLAGASTRPVTSMKLFEPRPARPLTPARSPAWLYPFQWARWEARGLSQCHV